MDTTSKWYEDPVYIKMCDNPDIQEVAIKRVKRDNGWLRASAVGEIANATAKNGEVFTFYLGTWLPYQHQLQGMVYRYPDESDNLWTTFNGIYDFVMQSPVLRNRYASQFTSMEQLWLAFVMKEKFNKTWTGTEWK